MFFPTGVAVAGVIVAQNIIRYFCIRDFDDAGSFSSEKNMLG